MMIRLPRPTVRLRLTLTYTALFMLTGAALLSASYVLVQRRETGPASAVQIICTGNNVFRQPQSGTVRVSGTVADAPRVNRANCPGLVGTIYAHPAGAAALLENGSASGGGVAPSSPLPGPIPGATAAEFSQLTATVKASQAHTLHSFKIESLLALGLLTIVSFGLSWWMAGRALRPVHRITDTARRLSEWTLHDRINLHGPDDELKDLADTFDAMLGRLDRAFHSQRRFVANASHELRTPLATERVLIDEALANQSARPEELRSILQQLRASSDDTERLIDALLLLARSERDLESWSTVDLSTTVASVIEQSGIEADAAGVSLSADIESAEVKGDPGLLERVVGNLVENAIRHNIPGGSVTVSTRTDLDRAILEVANTGPRLDPSKISRLVEPFRRAGPDRSDTQGGLGLGLSIVNAIVSTHRGTMTLAARDEGGLGVRIELPLANEVRGVQPNGDFRTHAAFCTRNGADGDRRQ